ncbi:MAG: hypothetical protein H8K07_08650 [Nitrospira sp.]|jgi:hypothetical protein|nr:hypothetical protein [Nitrospira sp.]MDI3462580.1 hypothetical protein [Nitrospira sp.]HEU5409265.1 hypothetical protein [Nitrospira sp.]
MGHGVIYWLIPEPKPAKQTTTWWLGWSEHYAHPDSPLGGGGPGKFRIAGPSGLRINPSSTIPISYMQSAKYPYELADMQAGNAEPASAGKSVSQQPPPKTVPRKSSVMSQKNEFLDIKVDVEVLPDGPGEALPKDAQTKFDTPNVKYQLPKYEYIEKNKRRTVTKLVSKFTITGTITIQTLYLATASPKSISAYGRGTTKEDIEAGNTSLGFHESCHREDFLRYLKEQLLPIFKGKVGMTVVEYKKAEVQFQNDWYQYWDNMDDDSERRTDEVGKKKSDYLKARQKAADE